MKYLGRMIVLAALGVVASVSTGTMAAGACTYGEALMALEQNNTLRAMALMRMASADGDMRATAFLAGREQAPAVLATVAPMIGPNFAPAQVRLTPR
ncbi:MAG: hypothetical protein GXP17_03685 [Gammaproteobacteria bacterium]|nr:hypothetical protein [Gammaproteobacteria bacterium]